jgi:hypothetical protein
LRTSLRFRRRSLSFALAIQPYAMNNTFRVLVPAVLLALSGCSRAEWFYGTWSFDPKFTLSHLTNSTLNIPKNPTPGVPDWVSPHPLLVIGQLAVGGYTYTITPKEVIAARTGQLLTNSYKVLRRPNPNEIILKTEKGETNSFRLVGDKMKIDIDLGFSLYFSRATN